MPDFRGLDALARRMGNHAYATAPRPFTKPAAPLTAARKPPQAETINPQGLPTDSAALAELPTPKCRETTPPGLTPPPSRPAGLGEGEQRDAVRAHREAAIIRQVFRDYYRMDVWSPDAWA